MESLTECQFRWFEQYIALSRLCLWNSCWDIYSKDKGREWMISGSLAPSHRPTSGHIFLMTSSNKNSLQINEDGSDITVTAKREMGRIQRKEKQTMFGRHMKVNTCTYFPESRSYAYRVVSLCKSLWMCSRIYTYIQII